MTYNYEEVTDSFLGGKVIIATLPNSDVRLCIPTDPANSDYQRYLRWIENPNEEDNGGLN